MQAGSNTFQIFDIDPENPTELTPVGEAIESKGDFPESLAWNTRGDKLCVLNGGVDSSVQYVPDARCPNLFRRLLIS